MSHDRVLSDKMSVNLARIKKHGQNFEVAIDPDAAMDFKRGKATIRDALKSDHIFHDAKKGLLASERAMQEIFGTKDPDEVAAIILREGEVQVSAEFRRKLVEEKEKQIVARIHRYAVDPKTGYPHPPERIRNAIAEAKVRIDEMKSADDQIAGIIKAIRTVLPISMETHELQLMIDRHHAHQCVGVIKGMAQIKSQNWQSDGSLITTLEVPAGVEQELLDKLNAMTHGGIQSKLLRTTN